MPPPQPSRSARAENTQASLLMHMGTHRNERSPSESDRALFVTAL